MIDDAIAAYQAGDYTQAIILFSKVLQQFPDHYQSFHNRGLAYFQLGQLRHAIADLQTALAIKPDYTAAHASLGMIYFTQSDFNHAGYHYELALKANPNLPDAWNHLSIIASRQNRWEAARRLNQSGRQVAPHHSGLISFGNYLARLFCDWDAITPSASTNPPGDTPYISLINQPDPIKNLANATWWSRYINTKVSPQKLSPRSPRRSPPYRLGYLSSDIQNNVIGRLIYQAFIHHNKQKFTSYIYSIGPNDHSMCRQQIEASVNFFRDCIGWGYQQIAEQIRSDQIDILIDLTSYTSAGYPEVAAVHPAPIQINYLGFPGSSGAPWFDYIIGDSTLTPHSHQHLYSEKIINLHHYMVTSYPAIKPTISTRQAHKLPADSIVFSNFNIAIKLNPTTFNLWIDILNQVPDSILWLNADQPTTINNIKQYASQHGLNPNRLIFAASVPYETHLQRIGLADIALDSPYYNGGATTADALYAGVPVVTLQGNRYVSRMSSALLSAVNLPKLVTHSTKEYRQLTIKLANDPILRQHLRTHLSSPSLPLFDTKAWVNDLETALLAIVE